MTKPCFISIFEIGRERESIRLCRPTTLTEYVPAQDGNLSVMRSGYNTATLWAGMSQWFFNLSGWICARLRPGPGVKTRSESHSGNW